ncbi:sugar transferase [Mangrovibacterium diazotrophicum]|uniref:Exopolysaccharide biosynthesis polyprenyl glycosylphosphotransferase n=1 Tax=Mangrovibacterium diazotrophicum TaxID=1261403 RepID=A0A419VWY2_9BACT|nr:sugar transferase [Mangrovibacterium diazotrophicum]RKD87728.1 exopolysaccharide biosynthesis polyprenyl glycosylphosphotransferase [Mangrovibacterium diazotrophicum]
MIKEREHVISKVNQIIQTALSALAFTLACVIYNYEKYPELLRSQEFNIFLLMAILTGWISVEYSALHRMSREESYLELFYKYVKVTAAETIILWLVKYYLNNKWIDLQLLTVFAAINLCLQFAFKASFFRMMKFFRNRGFNTRQLLIIADGQSQDFIETLINSRDWGYRITGIVTNSKKLKKTYGNQFSIIPEETTIDSILNQTVIDELIYSKNDLDYNEINALMELCSELGVVFRLRPKVFVDKSKGYKLGMLNDAPIYIYKNIPDSYLALKVKRIFDVLFSLVVLIVASPLLLVVALAIKLNDGGPVFFQQERVGLCGRRFGCLKFRTMVTDAEALKSTLMQQNDQSGPVFKMKYDPRITRVGRFLRKHSIDEFPQFFNVLNGDMSVVGPRPPIPDEVRLYERWQNRRLSMKPGLTCIWQVSGRNAIDFDEWVKLDTQYIDNWSLKLDAKIILKTIKVMIKGDGI